MTKKDPCDSWLFKREYQVEADKQYYFQYSTVRLDQCIRAIKIYKNADTLKISNTPEEKLENIKSLIQVKRSTVSVNFLVHRRHSLCSGVTEENFDTEREEKCNTDQQSKAQSN